MTNQQPTPPPHNSPDTTGHDFYTARQDAKRQRLEQRAQRLNTEGERNQTVARKFFYDLNGQPTLPGHHSYRADVNRRQRHSAQWDRGIEQQRTAEHLAKRAERIGTSGIASDDPNATNQLTRKLQALTDERDHLKDAGKLYRKMRNRVAKAKADTWRLTPKEAQQRIESADWRLRDDDQADEIRTARTEIEQLLVGEGLEPNLAHRAVFGNASNQFGVPSWEISNLTARIRTTAKRIEELEHLTIEDPDFHRTGTFPDGTTWECTLEEGRYRIRSDKPTREITRLLRSLGFNWSRQETAWQLKTTPHTQNTIGTKLAELGATLGEDQGRN